jgi:hypothetical protein
MGHGTKRFSKAFADIGIPSGHEAVGSSWCGFIDVVPQHCWLLKKPQNYNPDISPFSDGDNKLAETYLNWRNTGINMFDDNILEEIRPVLEKDLLPFFSDNNIFVDSNAFLSLFWPVISKIDWLDSRCIHVVRDPIRWAQKVVNCGNFIEKGGHYGNRHNPNSLFPDGSKLTINKPPFQRALIYWNRMHKYFNKNKCLVFKCEDFNKKETATAIIEYLYPEATSEQKNDFSLYHNIGRDDLYLSTSQCVNGAKHPNDFTEVDWDIFNKSAGLYKTFGYEYSKFRKEN